MRTVSHRRTPLLLALLTISLLAAAATVQAATKRSLKVTPQVASAKQSFRVAFKPEKTVPITESEDEYKYERYVVRMDWRGGRARACDRFASVIVERTRRGQWTVVRLKPNFPRRNPRWCAGTWVGRTQYDAYEVCRLDLCREDGWSRSAEERRFVRQVRR